MALRAMCYDVHISSHDKAMAAHTKRTRSYLAGEAISDFVDRELAIVEGIERGLEDMHAGRVVPHKTAMRRLRATVTRVAKEKS